MALPEDTLTQTAPARNRRFRQLAIAVLLVILTLAVWACLRPLEFLRGVGKTVLWANGIHGEYVQIGPNAVHYYSGGEGTPVVFVHGLGADALNWVQQMIVLKRQHRRVYAIDLLGHGQSAQPDIDYSIAEQSEMVRQFLGSQGIPSADMVGVSMGGWVVLNVTVEHPELVRRVVVADAAGLDFQTAVTADSFLPRTPAEFTTFWAMLSPRPLPGAIVIVPDFLRQVGKHEWIIRRIFASFLIRKDILDGRLGSINTPVLILWGKQERLIPMALGYEMQREIPRSSLLVCPDSGHLAVFECWDRFKPEVENFLDAPQPPAPIVREIAAER